MSAAIPAALVLRAPGFKVLLRGGRDDICHQKAMNLSVVRTRIQRLYQDGKPLNITAVKRHQPELIEAVYRRSPYLGWKKALGSAGVAYDKIQVEVSDVCRCEICGVEQGILTAHIQQAHKISGPEYRSRFPGAELTSEHIRAGKMAEAKLFPHWESVWSVEYVLDRIKECEIRGYPLNYTWISKNERSLAAACLTHLGSWDAGLARLGFRPTEVRLNARSVSLSRWDVIEELKKRKRQKLPMNYSAIQNSDLRLANAARRKFGSFRKALEAAGIKPEAVELRPAFYTRSDLKLLISEAKRVARLKGSARWNAAKVLHREFEGMAQSYYRNWYRVAEVAQVESYRLFEYRLCHKEFVIEWLAERAESGKRMTPSAIFDEDRGLYSAIRRHYGSVSEMLRQLEMKHFLKSPRKMTAERLGF